MRYCITLVYLFSTLISFSQKAEGSTTIDTTNTSIITAIADIPDRSLDYIDKKYSKLSNDVQKQSEKLLNKMQQQEAKLQKKLQGIDSSKAKELFATSKRKYEAFQNKIQSPINNASAKLKEYIPGLDSTNTALKFLSQPDAIAGLTTDKLSQLSSLTGSVQELQGRLQQANEIQAFIREREAQLKVALANTGLGKELLSLNKEVYYYQARVQEYKALLNDRKKLEEKLIATVRNLPAFKAFMQKHSYLALLFPTPDNYGTPAALAGLQTRASTQSIIAQRMGAGGMDPQQYIQQQSQAAQAELNKLKDKVNQLGGSSGSSDMTMPDFKPDGQKTKSFLQRLEYGFNIQNTRSTALLPSTSDFAVTLGYKVNDKISTGIGMSYKLGWGTGWDNIQFSSQGIGLRSYIDIRAKGSWWITGGWEYNYLQEFIKIEEIKNIDVWQKSALIGVTKKIKMGKKRSSNVQLLYDFMAARQVPQAQALKFRIGYSF